MPETFEERFGRQLSTYAEIGVRPFDPHVVARAAIAHRPRWGRRPGPAPWQGSAARSLRLALTISLMLALLAAAMLGAGALLPGGNAPSSSGLFVWTADRATFIGPDGQQATVPAKSPRGNSCPVLVGGTGIVAQGGFGKIHLTDLTGGIHTRLLDTNYAGGERWSRDRRRVALMRFEGTITIVSADDPEQHEVTIDAPGVVEVAWSDDGEHLAVARAVDAGGSLGIDLLDVSGEPVETLRTFTIDGVAPDAPARLLPSPDGSRILISLWGSQDAKRAYLGDVATSGLVQLSSDVTPVAWDPDGSRVLAQRGDGLVFVGPDGQAVDAGIPFAGPIDLPDWSPDGDSLAFVSDEELVTIDPVSKDIARLTLDRPTYAWSPGGSRLWVASAGKDADGLATILLQPYGPDLVPQDEPLLVPRRETDPICFSLSDVVVAPDGGVSAP